MALVITLPKFINQLTTDDSLPICDTKIKRGNNFLIIQNGNTIISQRQMKATFHLCSNKVVCCSIVFTLEDRHLQGRVTFSGEISNLQYEMSFYYVSSGNKFEFLETLNLPEVKKDSNYFLSRAYRFLFDDKTLLYQTDFNGQVCLLVNIKRKDSIFLKLDIPKNEIAAQFASLYKDQLLTDFKITCGDKEFGVHKAVLATRCTVFRAMFQQETKESRDNQMEITDFEPKIVEEMVSFLYTDQVNTGLTQQELKKIVKIADKYALEKLKIICIEQMTKTIENVREALEAYLNAGSYNVPNFKEAVLKFIEEIQQFPRPIKLRKLDI